jgi:hypothetical protein
MLRQMRKYYEVDDDDVDARGVVKDGGRVRVPLYMTDAAPHVLALQNRAPPLLHRPGPVRLSDAQIDIRERALAAKSVRVQRRLARHAYGSG